MRSVDLSVWLCLLIAVSGQFAVAAPLFSGDVNQDGRFDAADVVLLVNTLGSPSFGDLFGLELLVLDANQDGLYDSADTQRVVQIILGLANPLPLRSTVSAQGPVSLWRREAPSSSPPEENTVAASVSVWRRTDPQANENSADVRGSVRLWYEPAPAPTEDNADLRGEPSLWYQMAVPPVMEGDTFQRGTPSFDYETP